MRELAIDKTLHTPLNFIVHALQEVNDGLAHGRYFFMDVAKDGVALYEADEREQKIASSAGKSLIEEFWGGYIALIVADNGKHIIIRDPSGIMPCYWREDKGRILLSNDIETVACRDCAAHVNFGALSSYLASPGYSGDQTGISDVSELPAGYALVIQNAVTSVQNMWSPLDHISDNRLMTLADASEQLECVTRACIAAWASCFENIIIGVSGGLDSSIVAMLAAPNSHARFLNMYANDADGDERHYAQALTEHIGKPLEFGHFNLDEIDARQAVLPHRPWPNASFFASAIEAKHRAMCKQYPTAAFFSGNGGDSIFCSLRSTSPFLDRLLTEGPGAGLKETLLDLCTLTESDARTILKTAWTQYLKYRKGPSVKLDLTGLAAERESIIPLEHPWTCNAAPKLPGKAGHIGLLARAQQSHELYARSEWSPHIAPLLSQPIVELCLSIPSWLWVSAGSNRAVARTAFQDQLPEIIIRRTSKGGPGAFVQSVYRLHAPLIKERLRDGLLAKAGLIDKAYLDMPDDPSWRGNSRAQRLLQFAAAENWCRYWHGRSGNTA